MWAYYTCPFERSAITTAISICELTPADDKPIFISSGFIKVTSEVQEAQEEWLEIEIHRGGTAMSGGSGGSTAASGFKTTPGLPASGFQFEEGNTTLATFTSGEMIFRDAINVRAGNELRLTPEEVLGCTQANGGMDIRFPNAPADAIDYKGTIIVAEWI